MCQRPILEGGQHTLCGPIHSEEFLCMCPQGPRTGGLGKPRQAPPTPTQRHLSVTGSARPSLRSLIGTCSPGPLPAPARAGPIRPLLGLSQLLTLGSPTSDHVNVCVCVCLSEQCLLPARHLRLLKACLNSAQGPPAPGKAQASRAKPRTPNVSILGL